MNNCIPTSLYTLFSSFVTAFSTPSFTNFVAICSGWILCDSRHTISRVILSGRCFSSGKHHSVFYRFLTRARWITDSLGRIIFRLALQFVPESALTVIIDDTLCRKSGPHIWGAAMHHDPLISTYGRGAAKRHEGFAFGHNWVVLALWVPLPWNISRGMALPILVRLYRSKKYTSAQQYRKRTEIAAELITLIHSWVPQDRKLRVVGDNEYACKTVLRAVSEDIDFVGPVIMNAHLNAPCSPDQTRRRKRGRKPKRGRRLPSPRKLANQSSVPWKKIEVTIYGRPVQIFVKTKVVLWYSVCKARKIRLVVTRDPKGVLEDRAYFTTDVGSNDDEQREMHEVQATLTVFSRRWSLEVTFFNTKQFLGLEDPQNGWGKRKKARRKKKPTGSRPRGNKGSKAVQRTVPLILYVYGIVSLWYLENGSPDADVSWIRRMMPWYRTKRTVSFSDMLRAIRREYYEARIKTYPLSNRVAQDIVECLMEGPCIA
jgi:SRSO17 transposase